MIKFCNLFFIGSFLLLSSNLLHATTLLSDENDVGRAPRGWVTGITGEGSPKWTMEKDNTSPSKQLVLKQSGVGKFPWCVKEDVDYSDGFVEVKFKPLSGDKDQAGGLIWRWKDANNYYVARANALENNVSLYYTQNGIRNTIKYVDAPVAKDQWHILRATFNGKSIQVTFNGKTYIDLEDDHISGAGKIGVWTKADSVTVFDSFGYGKK